MAGPNDTGGTAAIGAPERVLVSVLAQGAVAALYLAREHDDNRLTSWRWVFAEASPALLFALAAAGIALANIVALAAIIRKRPALVLFLGSFAAGLCFWGEPEVIVDASRYFAQAKHLEIEGVSSFWAQWGRGIAAWTDLPLMPAIYGLAFSLLGEARAVTQALTTLMFAGATVLTFHIGKELWDEEIGLAGGAMLLASPYLLTQIPLMLVDVPTMFFFALAVYAIVLACRKGAARWIVAAALATSAAALVKYSTWPLLSAIPFIAAASLRAREPKALARAGAVALLAGAVVAAVLLAHRDTTLSQLSLLRGYQASGLRRWGESHVSTFLFQIHPFLTLAALASLVRALWLRDWKFAVVLWPPLLLAGLDVQRIRYWIPAFPMLALMAAFGLQALGERETRRLVAACAVATSLAVALGGFLPFLKTTSAMNLKSAGRYLDSVDAPWVDVYSLAGRGSEVNPAVSVPLLDLFTGKRLVQAEAQTPEPPKGVEVSALRFTWEYRKPDYYRAAEAEPPRAIAVISQDQETPWPEPLARRLEGYRLAKRFSGWEGLFGYRTLVDVYVR